MGFEEFENGLKVLQACAVCKSAMDFSASMAPPSVLYSPRLGLNHSADKALCRTRRCPSPAPGLGAKCPVLSCPELLVAVPVLS